MPLFRRIITTIVTPFGTDYSIYAISWENWISIKYGCYVKWIPF